MCSEGIITSLLIKCEKSLTAEERRVAMLHTAELHRTAELQSDQLQTAAKTQEYSDSSRITTGARIKKKGIYTLQFDLDATSKQA